MSCVIIVSRSARPRSKLSSRNWDPSSGKAEAGGRPLGSVAEGRGRVEEEAKVGPEEGMEVVMVRERRGMFSFFVSRIEAWEAFWADLRARWSGASGISRLIVLESAADWMV